MVAKYYHVSPLEVENWNTAQVNEWLEQAVKIEDDNAKAIKKASSR